MAARRTKKSQKAEITKIGKMTSPKGTAAYAYLNEPDDAFGKEKYRITVFFLDKKDPAFVKFVKDIKAKAKEFGGKNLPFKMVDQAMIDKAEEKGYESHPLGTPYIQYESYYNADDPKPIPVFNAMGKKDEEIRVFGGDIVKVEGTLVLWELNGDTGVKLYLNAVQQLKSNYKGGAGSSFTVEDEFLEDDLDDEETPVGDSFSADDAEDELEDEAEGDEEGDDDLDDLL